MHPRLFAVCLSVVLLAGCKGPGTCCDAALPYEGAPLYPTSAALPPGDLLPGKAFDAATQGRLDQAFQDALRHTRARLMSAAVASSGGSWKTTRTADGTTSPLLLYWASVGKALTAAVILQLEEEGKLSLKDPVSRWRPDLPHAGIMTVDHLLQHTSGLFSSNEDELVRARPGPRSADEFIAISLRHGPLFCPGRHWRYSNTGYVVLGKIIEAVDGRPYHEAVNARIPARLGLETLRALAPGEEAPDVAPLNPSDGAEPVLKPGWGYAAGGVVGSAEDMLRFWHALLTSRLLKPAATAQLFETLYPMFDKGTYYGRGVMLYSFEDKERGPVRWLGHSGGTPGARAVVAYAPDRRAFVAVALSGDGSAEAAANLLLSRVAAGN